MTRGWFKYCLSVDSAQHDMVYPAFALHSCNRFGNTSVEDGIIGDIPLTREEYIEAVELIRNSDGTVDHDDIEKRFGIDDSEVDTYTTVDGNGNTVEIDGPHTEVEWQHYEEVEARTIGAPYHADVNEDGSTRIDVQTPPDDAFWSRLDEVIPPPEYSLQ